MKFILQIFVFIYLKVKELCIYCYDKLPMILYGICVPPIILYTGLGLIFVIGWITHHFYCNDGSCLPTFTAWDLNSYFYLGSMVFCACLICMGLIIIVIGCIYMLDFDKIKMFIKDNWEQANKIVNKK